MSKIVITGGLGYVGTQLCKLHIPETLENEIDVKCRRQITFGGFHRSMNVHRILRRFVEISRTFQH